MSSPSPEQIGRIESVGETNRGFLVGSLVLYFLLLVVIVFASQRISMQISQVQADVAPAAAQVEQTAQRVTRSLDYFSRPDTHEKVGQGLAQTANFLAALRQQSQQSAPPPPPRAPRASAPRANAPRANAQKSKTKARAGKKK